MPEALPAVRAVWRQFLGDRPDLPTMAEAGPPGFEAAAVYALMAPLGTPKEIVALLHRETNAVLVQPELREKLAAHALRALLLAHDPGPPLLLPKSGRKCTLGARGGAGWRGSGKPSGARRSWR